MQRALANRPGEVPVFMAFDNDQPSMTITTAPRPDSPAATMTIQSFDRSTGKQIGMVADSDGGVMHFLLQLHTDMFLGLPGMLFLAVIGILFTAALISGVVLYAPFMRKLDFGTVRVSRSPRLKWLDYHNLLGIVALAWMLVVGLTGVINALSTPGARRCRPRATDLWTMPWHRRGQCCRATTRNSSPSPAEASARTIIMPCSSRATRR